MTDIQESIRNTGIGINNLNADSSEEQILHLRRNIEVLFIHAFKKLKFYFLSRDISIISGLSIRLENKIKTLDS